MTTRTFKTALITGITGSGGSYLADHIVDNVPGVAVHGIARWHSTSSNSNLRHAGNRAIVHECDLTDLSAILRVIKEVKPDVVFHIASHANVLAGFRTPLAVIQNNVMGTANLLEAIRLEQIMPVIQICSTSEVYGQVDPKDVPIKESCAIRPASPYAVSKVTQDLLAASYFYSFGLPIIRTRMFAYINPRRSDLFATSFATQVARIEAGLQEELLHGNLESTRTLIDVRDAMESYWIAAVRCELGEVYNIGGKTVITVGEFLETLKKLAKVPIRSRVDPNLLRPADVTLQIPDTSKFDVATGWKPKYSFEESVAFLLAACRARVAREAAVANGR
jgi:GDPmannose 4,6-dehydratase/GDP-4-dehydro-6-deoxy-D-mannose reductase